MVEVVKTLIDSSVQAKRLALDALQEGVANSAHVTEVHSTYALNEQIVVKKEWEVEYITSNRENLVSFLLREHKYECPEIMWTQYGSVKSFEQWSQAVSAEK